LQAIEANPHRGGSMASPFFAKRMDFTEVPRESGGGGTNIFYRYSDIAVAGTPAAPRVSFENLRASQKTLVGSRGNSAFQLFLTFHVTPRDGGRFDLTITRAEVDAVIEVNPKSQFETLADFADCYNDFATNGASAAERYVGRANGHWSTTFDGLRAKTMRHELDHVAFAVAGCQDLVDNFASEARRVGSTANDRQTPEQRVDALMAVMMGRFGFPYFDVGGLEHKKIALRDFFFMVAWYEEFELGLPTKSNEGYDAYVKARTDYRLKEAMNQVGESVPWL
jgi:hypothetical protein